MHSLAQRLSFVLCSQSEAREEEDEVAGYTAAGRAFKLKLYVKPVFVVDSLGTCFMQLLTF